MQDKKVAEGEIVEFGEDSSKPDIHTKPIVLNDKIERLQSARLYDMGLAFRNLDKYDVYHKNRLFETHEVRVDAQALLKDINEFLKFEKLFAVT